MDDDLFPSGPWTGFYNYSGPEDRHRMDLHLAFANGRMTGDGTDNIALFVIKGRYDPATRECWWTKTYPASHEVIYHGFREGVGIWGTWEIPPFSKGGFQIWPKREGMDQHESLTAETERPVEAVATMVRPGNQTDSVRGSPIRRLFANARKSSVVPLAAFPSNSAV